MNNKTVHNFTIKIREENVYDLYLDGKWIASRGHYENILDEVRNAIQYIDSAEENVNKV